MACLDVSSTITALRAQPEQFEFTGAWLHHIPRRHNFRFEPDGRVLISASCDCSRTAIAPQQREDLIASFREWQVAYWQPLRINREFASHFAPSSWLRRWLLDATAWLQRRLMEPPEVQKPQHAEAMTPAE